MRLGAGGARSAGEELQERVEKMLAAPILTVRRERKGRQTEDDIRPAILALSVTSPNGHLRAELATHPRGVRPGDLVAALGTARCPDGPVERINGSNAMAHGSSRSP